MYQVTNILESIRWMGSGDSFPPDIAELFHDANVRGEYSSIDKVAYNRKILKHNHQCTCPDHLEETLSYSALLVWYNIDSTRVLVPLFATNQRRSTCCTNSIHFQTMPENPCFHLISQQLYRLTETHVCWVCNRHILSPLRDVSEDIGISNFGQQFRADIDEYWGHQLCGLMLRYNQQVLIHNIFI